MLRAADVARMAADLDEVLRDNSVRITIRRGEATLAAQTVRVARTAGMPVLAAGGHSAEHRARVVVLGNTALDIAVADRFTVAGILYQVTAVRPNRRAAVVAEAEGVS